MEGDEGRKAGHVRETTPNAFLFGSLLRAEFVARSYDRPSFRPFALFFPLRSIAFSFSFCPSLYLSFSLFRSAAEKQILFRVTEPAGRLTPSFGFPARGVRASSLVRTWNREVSIYLSFSLLLLRDPVSRIAVR